MKKTDSLEKEMPGKESTAVPPFPFPVSQLPVVLASITSCTNTSNPNLMIAAGLLAKKAVEKGLRTPAFVKTSFAPGSRAVTAYLENAGLLKPLETLSFHVVGYGCMTCIGNSGPLSDEVEKVLEESGEAPLRREGRRDGGWILIDFGCVVVHLFLKEAREFYTLERLWGDAEVL